MTDAGKSVLLCTVTSRPVEQPLSYYLPPWKTREHLRTMHGYKDGDSVTHANHEWEHDNDGRHTAPGHTHAK